MTTLRIASATLLLLTMAACNGAGTGSAANVPQSAVAPSGIQATGSAGMTGGAAAAPAGVGTVSTTTIRR